MSDARALADDALDREADYAGYGETLEQLTIRAETAEARAAELEAALRDCLRLLEWDGDYDEAMQWRDWQACDLLLDDRGRSPLRDQVLESAREALSGVPGSPAGEKGACL
jgi:hypothetical protein